MRRLLSIIVLCTAVLCTPLTGQDDRSTDAAFGTGGNVITAASFFKSLSDRYAAIGDYEAAVTVSDGHSTHTASLSCKGSLLRMDFSSPKGQTIVFNGDALIVYLPEYSAVLQQVTEGTNEGGRLGLSLISRYYFVQYASANEVAQSGSAGQDERMDSDNDNMVTLVAYPRGAAEAFRSITLDVDRDNMLIAHVTAEQRSGGTIELTFSRYAINTGIPNERFVYDPPSSANYYNNFLMGSAGEGGGQ